MMDGGTFLTTLPNVLGSQIKDIHTAFIFWYALISSMFGLLPNLHVVNQCDTDTPKLLLNKSYILSWLFWTQSDVQVGHTLPAPSQAGYASTLLRHDGSHSPSLQDLPLFILCPLGILKVLPLSALTVGIFIY